MSTPLATAVPPNTGDGYVAAAYIVFLALLLIYVAIMALRLSHVERDLRELRARNNPEQATTAVEAPHEDAHDQPLEREPA